jgi:hypothetical protein
MGHAALCPLMLRTYSRVIAVTAMARLTPGTGAFLVSNFHPPVGGLAGERPPLSVPYRCKSYLGAIQR